MSTDPDRRTQLRPFNAWDRLRWRLGLHPLAQLNACPRGVWFSLFLFSVGAGCGFYALFAGLAWGWFIFTAVVAFLNVVGIDGCLEARQWWRYYENMAQWYGMELGGVKAHLNKEMGRVEVDVVMFEFPSVDHVDVTFRVTPDDIENIRNTNDEDDKED